MASLLPPRHHVLQTNPSPLSQSKPYFLNKLYVRQYGINERNRVTQLLNGVC